MTSEKQKEANRQNARLSTGPKTEAGKETSRLNALKHGLTGAEVLYFGEEPEEYFALAEGIRTELAPEGQLQEALVSRVISILWRLRRASFVEGAILNWRWLQIERERATAEMKKYDTQEQDFQAMLTAHADTGHPIYQAALAVREGAAAEMDKPGPTLGATYIREAKESDTLTKISKHEAALERSLFATLLELREIKRRKVFGGGFG